MKHLRFVVAWVAGLALVGCASDTKEESVTWDKTPIAVRMGVEKSFPDAKVMKVAKEQYKNGTVHYEVELVTKDGKEREEEFAPDGELLEKH